MGFASKVFFCHKEAQKAQRVVLIFELLCFFVAKIQLTKSSTVKATLRPAWYH